MGATLQHRGPDDTGLWTDGEAGIGLVHRRLSVLDLSTAGHQPMISAGGRYVMVFNGEIYNHLELRKMPALAGITWRGHSDTETLLASIGTLGIQEALQRSVGMFALAVWDRTERALYLARDRMGEKPLYYGWQNNVLLFASELKALKQHPAFQGSIDRDALTLLMRHCFIPAPCSIYQGIRKLQPAAFIRIETRAGRPAPAPVQYWSLPQVFAEGSASPFGGSDSEAIAELEALLSRSTRLQMMADVPVGAFLSGGVDSSTVAALMQSQSRQPIRTFTIGFYEAEFNEAQYAKAVARHLGTQHTELYVTPREALEVVPRLPVIYDEPFADASQIPTVLVSALTREQVTVSLSGDGGDELFGGYNRYFVALDLWRNLQRLPLPFQTWLARGLIAIAPAQWDRIFRLLSRVTAGRLAYASPGDKVHKLAETMATCRPEQLYLRLVSHWERPSNLVLGGTEPQTAYTDHENWAITPDFESRMMLMDALCYLPDDILAKVDRAAMSVSLETRVPLLDHRIVEFAARLPLSLKIRDGVSKWALRQVLYKHVPARLIDRPKMGFGVPIDRWLRSSLRDWAEDLLAESSLKHDGYLDPAPIREKWAEHLSGSRNWQYYLWDVLMFQAWLKYHH